MKKEKIAKKNIGINYQGTVRLSFVKNGREVKSVKLHNTGCLQLFKYLANCLIGDYKLINSPQYLMLYNNESTITSSSLGTELLSYPIFLSSCERVDGSSSDPDEDSYSTARLRYIIPGTAILTDKGNGNVLAIIDSTNTPLAYIELTGNDIINTENIPTDSNIIIVWELKVSN